MQLTAQMLHSAFLESYREVYGIPETQQRSWENLNDKEHLAYQWMESVLQEKLATQGNERETLKEQLRQAYAVIQTLNETLALMS